MCIKEAVKKRDKYHVRRPLKSVMAYKIVRVVVDCEGKTHYYDLFGTAEITTKWRRAKNLQYDGAYRKTPLYNTYLPGFHVYRKDYSLDADGGVTIVKVECAGLLASGLQSEWTTDGNRITCDVDVYGFQRLVV